MAWNRKKIIVRLEQYFDSKHIPYEYDEENSILKLELCFKEGGFMLYPYLTIEDSLCTININIAKYNVRGYSYDTLNEFNQKSKLFKGYLTTEGIVALEYSFCIFEVVFEQMDLIFSHIFSLEKEIDRL